MNKRLADDFKRAFNGVAQEAHRIGVSKGWWPGVAQGAMPGRPEYVAQGAMPGRPEYVAQGAMPGRECGRNDGELIALIHSELSEALEALRHGDPADDKVPEFRGAETEMADAIIRIMDMAVARGWHIAEALVAKMAFNETRPHRHGGKRF